MEKSSESGSEHKGMDITECDRTGNLERVEGGREEGELAGEQGKGMEQINGWEEEEDKGGGEAIVTTKISPREASVVGEG